MKIPKTIKILCSFLCTMLFLSPHLDAQTYKKKRTNAIIPRGQLLYSQETKNVANLIPYQKEYKEVHNQKVTKIIEIGDYQIKEEFIKGQIQRDTLCFGITTYTINGQDTIKSFEQLELMKRTTQMLEANVYFSNDKILVEVPKPKNANPYIETQKTIVNISDRNLYYKLGPKEKFFFNTRSGTVGAMTIPIKLRFSSGRDSIASSANFGFNNIHLFAGFKTGWHKYRYGKFSNINVSIGPYLGPSVIKLNRNNTDNTVVTEKSQLAWSYGATILFSADKLNFGLSVGAESLADGKDLNWIHQNKVYLGFAIGYSLNALTP